MKTLLFLFALAVATVISPLSAQVPPGTASLTFNGYCDGMTITVSGDQITGTHDNYDCNGSQTWVNGIVATGILLAPTPIPDSRANVASNVGLLLPGCPENYYLDFNSGKWAQYRSCDGTSPESLFNTGTFTINGTARQRGGVASYQVQHQGVDVDSQGNIPDLWGPTGTFTVSWDGYCDFMTLNSKGTRLGGDHDFTNCDMSVIGQVAGNNANLPADASGVAGKGGILQSNANLDFGYDITMNYYTNWSAGTWCNYYEYSIGQQFLYLCGTFTLTQGIPVVPKGLPPTISIRR